jgi:hypothetical protein
MMERSVQPVKRSFVFPFISSPLFVQQRAPNWSGVEPISEHEAHQFLRYAARVRYLSVGTEVHLHLLTVFPILEARMFPRLLALEWKPDTNTMLHLFLSPTLRRCALTDVHSDSKSIGTLCHGLESLSIWGEVTLEAYDLSLLSESVRSCKRLKHLRCPSLDSAAWKYLSNLPTLVTLAICNGPYNALLDRDNIILAPFLNVTALTFHSRSATDIITIIQHSEFPSLKEFGATVDDLPWSDSEQLFHALARCKACHTLEIIHVDVFYPATERSDGTSTAIRQLLCFPQLRALRLSIQSFIHIDNDVLLEAMPSWPHIRSLELYSQRLRVFQPEGPPPTVTFRGLFAVLRLCPNLQALWLDIDAVNIDIDPENESFQHTSLQELDVCSSIAEDPERVTRIISTMLPRISTVIYNPTPFTSRGVWDEVNTRLRKN